MPAQRLQSPPARRRAATTNRTATDESWLEQRAHDALVGVDGGAQLIHGDELVGGMRHVNGTRTEHDGLPTFGEQRAVRRVRDGSHFNAGTRLPILRRDGRASIALIPSLPTNLY